MIISNGFPQLQASFYKSRLGLRQTLQSNGVKMELSIKNIYAETFH